MGCKNMKWTTIFLLSASQFSVEKFNLVRSQVILENAPEEK